MPYIPDKHRRFADQAVYAIIKVLRILGCKGTLNYILYKVAKQTCTSYGDWSRFIAELECCKLEIYRRQLGPYEQEAIKRNGDIY